MKALAFAVALTAFAAATASAQTLVARQGDDSVRLSDQACTSQLVLERVEQNAKEEYRAATAVFQGQNFVACWRVLGGVAHLVYEDGDQGIIPMAELQPELTA